MLVPPNSAIHDRLAVSMAYRSEPRQQEPGGICPGVTDCRSTLALDPVGQDDCPPRHHDPQRPDAVERMTFARRHVHAPDRPGHQAHRRPQPPVRPEVPLALLLLLLPRQVGEDGVDLADRAGVLDTRDPRPVLVLAQSSRLLVPAQFGTGLGALIIGGAN